MQSDFKNKNNLKPTTMKTINWVKVAMITVASAIAVLFIYAAIVTPDFI